jgi:predicted house-cleaning noncanonical NTP pyrophosphatase (MazG superfamily)
MKYDKLVRDKIPEYIRGKGGDPKSHVADTDEYWRKLKEKLEEAVKEFVEAENVEEYADVLEVLEEIRDFKQFSEPEIIEVKNKKADERGKFRDRIILEEA